MNPQLRMLALQVVGGIMIVFGAFNHDVLIVIAGAAVAVAGLVDMVINR